MEIEDELHRCRVLIEERLGWGSSSSWATHDYELLSQKIQEVTEVNLSIATLKRIWGKIRYDSKPTITTLNTLAQYLGFENWRAFAQTHTLGVNGQAHPINGQSAILPKAFAKRLGTRNYVAISALVVAAAAGVYWKVSQKEIHTKIDPGLYSFSSKQVLGEGVPNTVIFDYDASTASPNDTVLIQQSWDKRLRQRVPHDQKQHASIYYYPGFFQAKLKVNEQVVKEHNLFIKTKGWLPLVEQKPVPVYFKEGTARHNGVLSLSVEALKSYNINLQPATPWVAYYNIREFDDLKSDAFYFETEVRNDFNEGSGACQHTEVHVLFEGAALVIPLSMAGCVSELNFMGKDGKKADLSALGCNLSDWVRVACEFKNKEAKIFINQSLAFTLQVGMPAVKIVGLAYRFQGTGSVNFARLSRINGRAVYEENF